MRLVVLFLVILMLPLSVQAGEVVINADTGVNIGAIKTRVDISGAQSMAPDPAQFGVSQTQIQQSRNVVRIRDRNAQAQDAAALNWIAPAAGEPQRPPSDGGALARMPLTESERYVREQLGIGSRP
jgi:hypothetical protein